MKYYYIIFPLFIFLIMINIKNNKIFLCVSQDSTGFRIQPGFLKDPNTFFAKMTLLVPKNKPNLLWDLFHKHMGFPFPKIQLDEPTTLNEVPDKNIPEKENNLLNDELWGMSAKQIVEKIRAELGVEITMSLKSKKAIINKVLKLYSEKTV